MRTVNLSLPARGNDTVVLASNTDSQYGNKFRGYKNSTATGFPDRYPYEFTLYKATDSGETVTIATPQATPQGSEVASGTQIALTCATEGASIYYTLNGSDPADSSNSARQLYSEDSKPTITENCTLKAIAVLGENKSAVQTLTYTIKEVEYVYQQITELNELLAGGNFVFAVEIAEGKYQAIGSAFNYQDYLEGVEATVEDGVLTFGEDMQILLSRPLTARTTR